MKPPKLQLHLFNPLPYQRRTLSARRFAEYSIASPFERPELMKTILAEWLHSAGGAPPQQQVVHAYLKWVEGRESPNDKEWSDWMKLAFRLMCSGDALTGQTFVDVKSCSCNLNGITVRFRPDAVYRLGSKTMIVKFWFYSDRQSAEPVGEMLADIMNVAAQSKYEEPVCVLVDVFSGTPPYISREVSAAQLAELQTLARSLVRDWRRAMDDSAA